MSKSRRYINRWRIIEMFLLCAIIISIRFTSLYSAILPNHEPAQTDLVKSERTRQPLGGPIPVESANPVTKFRYYLDQVVNRSPELLPDIMPILGDDDAFQEEYPGTEQWRIDRSTFPGRTLLRINTLTTNIGTGPLHIVGGRVIDDGKQQVYQRIWRADQTFVDQPAGTFAYHPSHDHIHFDNYAQYHLRLLDSTGAMIASGRKLGFCLTDVIPVDKALFAASSIQLDLPAWECGTREQGINSGWSDYYGAALPDQWIDITNVPYGDYALEIVVDPHDLIREADEDNNTLTLTIHYSLETTENKISENKISENKMR